MKVHILNQRQISVLLSDADMEELALDPDRLREGSADTAQVLWEILNKAGGYVNLKTPLYGEVYIDIELEQADGCRMTFTLPKNSFSKRSNLKKGLVSPIIFHFENLDHLLALRDVLLMMELSPSVKSDLFCLGDCYRLIIYQPFRIFQCIPVLHQFASSVKGTVNVAYTKEHWMPVTQTNALQKMLMRSPH